MTAESHATLYAKLSAAVPISAELCRVRTLEDLLAVRGDDSSACHPPLVPANQIEWSDGDRP